MPFNVIALREVKVSDPLEVRERIIDDFVLDMRMLYTIYGTLDATAYALGVCRNSVQYWLKKRKLPSFEMYIKIKEHIARVQIEAEERLREG